VVLFSKASARFQAAYNDDLVLVPTRHGCGDSTGNQVIALRASNINGPPVWTFNLGGNHLMDYAGAACSIDYARDTAYCGSNLNPGASQPTVWAINLIGPTSSPLVPNLAWAANYGSVHTTPTLSADGKHLYVATQLGHLKAIDPTTGALLWSVLTNNTVGARVELNPTIGTGLFSGVIWVTDTLGVLHAIADNGNSPGSGIHLWSKSYLPTSKVTTSALFDERDGYLYVCLDDGTVHQLTASNHLDSATWQIADTRVAGTEPVSPLAFEAAIAPGRPDYLIALAQQDPKSGGGVVRRTAGFPIRPTTFSYCSGGGSGDFACAAADNWSFTGGEQVFPANAVVPTGSGQGFSLMESNGLWPNLTAFTVFTISGGGSCNGSTCSASTPGKYTVTASYCGGFPPDPRIQCPPSPVGVNASTTLYVGSGPVTSPGAWRLTAAGPTRKGAIVRPVLRKPRRIGLVVLALPSNAPVGFVPLGRHQGSNQRIRWNLKVNGHVLPDGTYEVYLNVFTRPGKPANLPGPKPKRLVIHNGTVRVRQ
jgi:hypothetical protein